MFEVIFYTILIMLATIGAMTLLYLYEEAHEARRERKNLLNQMIDEYKERKENE